MPTAKHRKVQSTLMSKFRFYRDETDHSIFILLHNGRRVVDTKLSHGSRNKDLSKGLFSKVARDLQLTSGQFQQAIQCSLSRDDYISVLGEKGLL